MKKRCNRSYNDFKCFKSKDKAKHDMVYGRPVYKGHGKLKSWEERYGEYNEESVIKYRESLEK